MCTLPCTEAPAVLRQRLWPGGMGHMASSHFSCMVAGVSLIRSATLALTLRQLLDAVEHELLATVAKVVHLGAGELGTGVAHTCSLRGQVRRDAHEAQAQHPACNPTCHT